MAEETRLRITMLGDSAAADAWARALRGVEGVEVARAAAADDALLGGLVPPEGAAIAVTADVPDLAGIIKRALMARRHVFVARPVALAPKQLTAIDELARARERIAMFDTGDLADERLAFVRRMIAGPHALWRPRYMRSLRAGESEHSIDQLAIADVHLLLSVCGIAPSRVTALSPRFDDETGSGGIVTMTLAFDGGPAARIDISLVEPRPAHELTLVCDGRTIALDAFDLRAPLQILAGARHSAPASGGAWAETVSEHPLPASGGRMALAADAFVAAVRGGDAAAGNAAPLALAAGVWEAARASMAQGGEWVPCGRAAAPGLRPELHLIKGGGRGGEALHAPELTLVPRQAYAAPDPPRSA